MQQQQTTIINAGQVNAGFTGQPGPAAVVQMPYGQPLTRTPNVVANFQHLQSLHLGIVLVIAGGLSIIFNIVDLAVGSHTDSYNSYYLYYESLGFIGHGFWSGIMCIIAGGFGIGASKTKTVGMIRAFLVLSILAACFCLAQMGIAIAGACISGYDYDYGYYCSGGNGYDGRYGYNNGYGSYRSPEYCNWVRTLIAMEALLAILSLVGGVAALWGSALGCKAACCCSCCCCNYYPSTTNGVVYYNAPNTFITQQQQQQQLQPGVQPVQMMYPGQPQVQGFQYVHPGIPGQQFVAGPSYVVAPPPVNPPYKPPAPLTPIA